MADLTVAWTDEDSDRTGAHGQSLSGRLWDVLWMSFVAVRRTPRWTRPDRVEVELYRISRHADTAAEPEAELVRLKAVVALHDDGSPVLLIGLPEED